MTTEAWGARDVDAVDAYEELIRHEPADPTRPDHEARRQTRLAPESFDSAGLPKPLVECGCDSCIERADPLHDGESLEALSDLTDDTDFWAAELCPDPQPMTVERAGVAWRTYKMAAVRREGPPYPLKRATATFANIMEGDRRLIERYGCENLTTVLLSRRLSPLSEHDEWLAPLTLEARLLDETALRSVRRAVNSAIDGFDAAWMRMVTTTDSAATPHEHWLIWANDPDDEIDAVNFGSVIDRHVKHVTGACGTDHRWADDGSEGGIRVETTPPMYDGLPEKAESVIDKSETGNQYRSENNTAAAYYVATQLPSIYLNGLIDDDRPTPDQRAFEGGAIAWAGQYNWVSSSQTFPTNLSA